MQNRNKLLAELLYGDQDNKKLVGEPDRSLVNRTTQKYEIDYFVDEYCKLRGIQSPLEKIRVRNWTLMAPSNKRSRENLIAWLDSNLK